MCSWCVSQVSGYGCFKVCPEPECFLSRQCNLQTLEIMLGCWCQEVWGNLLNTIHFFKKFWLSWCNEVWYQQCTVSACIMIDWKSASSLVCKVNILAFLLVFFVLVWCFFQDCRHIHMLLWAKWRCRQRYYLLFYIHKPNYLLKSGFFWPHLSFSQCKFRKFSLCYLLVGPYKGPTSKEED